MTYDDPIVKRVRWALAAGHSLGSALANTDALLTRGDARFEESKHPRDPEGKFGSGSGKAPYNAYSKEGVRKLNETRASKIPFVASVFKEHQTSANIREYLTTVPTEKLKTAQRLLDEHADKNDGEANSLNVWIDRELNNRADKDFNKSTGGKK
ncbi:MAG: hypothetical protein KGJ13_12555 [Patescibacteria group bacterium]|nr:hypothetical protein [Patescibacteria group bacterium]